MITREDGQLLVLKCDTIVAMNHRHHCRICGKGHFCDKCAPRRSQLFNLRICNGCYEKNSSNDLLDIAYLKVEDLNDDTLLLVINGCDKTGLGSYSLGLFPDLEIICNKIMRLFTGTGFTVNKDRN